MSIRVVAADPCPLVRAGLGAVLNNGTGITVVGEASNGEELRLLVGKLRPDVAVLDLRIGGSDLTRKLLEEHPQTRVVIFTDRTGEEDVYGAIQAGATGFVAKGTSVAELIGAVRAAHAGERAISGCAAAALAARVLVQDLTARELAVLRHVVTGQSNREIARSLAISEGTVKGHLNGVFAKLGVRDRTHAAITAIRRGIVHLEE